MTKLIWGLICVCVLVPAWLIGGVHVQTHILFLGITSLLFFFVLVKKGLLTKNKKVPFSFLYVFSLLFIGLTCFQLLPLPDSWVAFLSPAADQLFRSVLQPLELYGSKKWMALSLSPGNTAQKVLHDWTLFLLFLATFFWVQKRENLRNLMQISVTSAMLFAGFIVVHTVLQSPFPYFGAYVSSFRPEGFLLGSPFINSNHMGGFFLLHTFWAFSLFNSVETGHSHKLERTLTGVASIVLPLFVLMSLSRGATLSLAILFIFFFGGVQKLFSRTKTELKQKEQPFIRFWKQPAVRLFLLLFGMGLCVIFVIASEPIKEKFSKTRISTQEDKLSYILRISKPMLASYPRLGVGRGALPVAYHQYANEKSVLKGQLTPSHIESLLIQPLIDWGYFFGILFLVILVTWIGRLLLFFYQKGRSSNILEFGALCGLVALLLQNVADFNLEYLGTSMPAIAIFGAIYKLHLIKKQQPKQLHVAWFGPAMVLSLIFLLLLSPLAYKHNYRRVTSQWSGFAKKEIEDIEKEGKKWILLHPADALLPIAVAQRLLLDPKWQADKAIRWLKIAEKLNPTAAQIYYLRGYMYARLGMLKESVENLDKVLFYDPRYIQNVAKILKHYKQLENAFEKTKEEKSAYYLFWVMTQEKTSKELRPLLKNAIKRFPNSFDFHSYYGQEWLKEIRDEVLFGDTPPTPKYWIQKKLEIAAFTDQMKKQFGKNDGIDLLLQGRLLLLQKKYKESIPLFQKLFATTSQFRWYAFVDLASALSITNEENEFKKVISIARNDFRKSTMKAYISYTEGLWYKKKFRYNKAASLFDEAIQNNPLPHYEYERAVICREQGDLRCTVRILKKLVRLKQYKHLDETLKKIEERKNLFQPTQ